MVRHRVPKEIKGFVGLLAFCTVSTVVLFWNTGQFGTGKRHRHTRDLLFRQRPHREHFSQSPDITMMLNATKEPVLNIETSVAVVNSILVNTTGSSRITEERRPLMVTLDFEMGRTGNCMFQYASLLGITTTLHREPFISPGWTLEQIFELSYVREIHGTKKWTNITERSFGIYMENFFHLPEENVTIHGYLQSWKYFRHIEDTIKKEFTFRTSTKSKVNGILSYIRKENKDALLVGVHVRRGDFLSSLFTRMGYSVARKSYFFKAFDWFREQFPNKKVLFLVVSDDLPWCDSNLAGSDVKVMPEDSPSVHLGILAHSDHVIMAGGTFGWWGGWLAGGHVVYYNNFPLKTSMLYKHFIETDFYPPHWVGLGD